MGDTFLFFLNSFFHPSCQRQISEPIWLPFGHNEYVYPHTSIFSAYNVIKSPKEVFLVLKLAHSAFQELREQISGQLKK